MSLTEAKFSWQERSEDFGMYPNTGPSIFLHASAYSNTQHREEVEGVLDVSMAVMETACLLQNVI